MDIKGTQKGRFFAERSGRAERLLCTFSLKIFAEMFGDFRFILYLCNQKKELLKGGRRRPDAVRRNEFLIP